MLKHIDQFIKGSLQKGYKGNLNGIENAVVLFCWPENAFKKEGALHTFLCTYTELSTKTILEYYSKRWPIEI